MYYLKFKRDSPPAAPRREAGSESCLSPIALWGHRARAGAPGSRFGTEPRSGTETGQVELFIATPDKVRPLFEDHPHLVELFSFDRQKHGRHWHELIKWARKRRFDLVYDSRRSPFSRFLKARLRMTPQLDRQRVLDKRHKLAQNAGVASLQEAPRPRIHLAPARLARFADLPRPAFVLAPKSNWAPKDWSLHHYIALVRAVLAQPALKACHFYLLGLQTQAAACQSLVEAIPPAQCHPMFGTHGLLDVASLCQSADLFLGSDSGLLHMAHCVACPTIGLYAVADDRVYGPWHAGGHALRGRPNPPEGEKKARPRANEAMQALGLDPVLNCVKAQLTQSLRSPSQSRF